MQNKDNNNFWIVYADLMAGLLFVFILVLSGLTLRYFYTQDRLKQEEKKLNESKNLIISKDELLKSLNEELAKLNLSLGDEKEKNQSANEYIKELIASLDEKDEKNSKLLSNIDEKDAQILILLKNLEENDVVIKNQNEKLEELSKRLSEFKINYQKLKDNKSKLIQALQQKLTKDILINLNSGSISLNASILFDSGEFSLKVEAKEKLQKTLTKYFDAILSSKQILANISNIVIEGYTDSDGGYLYNLELSQKRALEIMKFINSFYKDKRIEKLLVAVGKGYNELVYKNGIEDKQASRRIEIKLLFNNEAATKEFERSIDENSLN